MIKSIKTNEFEIFNGDCLEVMKGMISKNEKVNAIICDPPYKVISGGSKRKKGSPSGMLSKNDGKIFEHNDLKEEEWFKLIYELLEDNSHAYIMVNVLNLENYLRVARETGFLLHNLLAWKKNNCTPSRWYMKNAEYTLFLRKGKAKPINNGGSKTIHEFDNIIGNKLHPCEKPVDLMEFYILNSTKEGDTVLDFSMGSGSTGEACLNTNRKFKGIEIDKNHFRTAEARLLKKL